MRARLPVPVVALLLVSATAGCESSGGTAGPSPEPDVARLLRTAEGPVDAGFVTPANDRPDAIARAYRRSVAGGTAVVRVVLSSADASRTHGEGVIDFKGRRSRLVLKDDYAPFALGEALDVNGVLFRRGVDTSDEGALRRAAWVAFPVSTVLADNTGAFALFVTPPESMQFLGLLKAEARQVTVSWPGKPGCDGYAATVGSTGEDYVSGPRVEVAACADAEGRLSRVVYRYPDGSTPTTSLFEFSDYGAPVEVTPPREGVGTL